MREIKFRAKRIDDGRWVYGQYFKTPLTDENSGTKPEDGWFFLCGEERHCIVQDHVSFVIDINTLGQCTGLKDKNGKEIYEGDIVHIKHYYKDREHIGKVYYDYNGFSVMGFNFPHFDNPNDAFEEGTTIFEVIGNIYENPELIKEEETEEESN